MKRSLALPFLLLALAVLPLRAQEKTDPVVAAILEEGRERSQVMAHLDHLVNGIGPRLTSSDRLAQACEWAKGEFERWGLKNCRLEPWGTFPVGFNRGPARGRMVQPAEMDLVFTTRAWTPGTDGPKRAPVVLGPYSLEDLQAVRAKLPGAWVLSPGKETLGDVNRKILAAYDEAGILGLIRSGQGELVHTDGNHNIEWDRLPKRPSITLLEAQYRDIRERLKKGEEVVLEFDIKNEFKKGPIPLHNVIAEIPGTSKRDELVIVGGHIDSWDGATGTTDNGTGTATTMEAARLLARAGAKPLRTIRFMLWSGEEQGLLGSRAYIQAHPEESPRISAVLVHDGGTNYVAGIQATEPMVPLFERIFAPVREMDPEMPFEIRKVATLTLGIGSDHDSYLKAGVPGFFWIQKGRAVYKRTHHTQFDTFDAAIPEYQRHTALIVAIGAWGVANLEGRLPRVRQLGISFRLEGLRLSIVRPGSVAARAGLREGDRILRYDGREVAERGRLSEMVQAGPRVAKILLEREGKEMEVTVEFED